MTTGDNVWLYLKDRCRRGTGQTLDEVTIRDHSIIPTGRWELDSFAVLEWGSLDSTVFVAGDA